MYTRDQQKTEQLITLHKQGLTSTEIAEKLGYAQGGSVRTALRSLGFTRRPRIVMTDELIDKAEALRAQGMTYRKIAKKLGVNCATVQTAVKRRREVSGHDVNDDEITFNYKSTTIDARWFDMQFLASVWEELDSNI